jgi:hypothetical protein
MLTKTPPELIAAPRLKGPRDPRLDFFRGIALMIILVSHVPFNDWALWIPARFGFSDATEIFVFLSGMASAIAYGRLFDREGGVMLVARTAQRVWQIYWAHLCVFLVVAALMAAAGTRPTDGVSYMETLNLHHFVADPGRHLVGLLTLTYVPNYFDILPMYMVVMALMPLMLYAEKLHKALPFVLMVAMWLPAQFDLIHLPAEYWSTRPWFFDPFGWQLLFFLGFFVMRGSIRLPRPSRQLIVASIAIVIATVPFAWYVVLERSTFFRDAALALFPLTDKTDFGILRLVHFMALACLATAAVGYKGERLRGPVVGVIMKVGQQTLPVFVTGMALSQFLGIALDYTGRTALPHLVINCFGFAVLIATAYLVAWFKQSPRRDERNASLRGRSNGLFENPAPAAVAQGG